MSLRYGLAGVSVLALVVSAGSVAAQSAPQSQPAVTTIDEVVVTARRREEVLRDVPASVSAITAGQIAELTVDGMTDFIRQVPGAQLITTGPEFLNDFSIRGQGSGRLGVSETATGIYKDGVYVAGGLFGGRALSRMDLFDIDRLEVLRGPQGALFGRNSVGGAANAISTRPGRDFGGRGKVGWWDTERFIAELAANIPVTDEILMRLAGFTHDQTEGHIVNTGTGDFVDQQSFSGVRATGVFGLTDRVDLDLMYEYSTSVTPAYSSVGYRANAPAGAGGYAQDASPYERTYLSRDGYADVDNTYVSGSGTFDFPVGTVQMTASHRQRDGLRSNEDADHYAGLGGYSVLGQAIDLTQEQSEDFNQSNFQVFLSSPNESAIKWLVGAEVLQNSILARTTVGACPAYTGAAVALNPGCNPGGGAAVASGFSGSGAVLTAAQAGSARTTSRFNLNDDTFDEELTSYSFFGSLEFALADRITLGVEGRIQTDKKEFSFQRFSLDPLAYFGPDTSPAAGFQSPPGLLPAIVLDLDPTAGIDNQPAQFCPPSISGTAACAPTSTGASRDTLIIRQESEDSQFTPTATLRYEVSDDASAYLRFATGYRPGGFNINPPPGLSRTDVQRLISYQPEYASSYELGLKGRTGDGRIRYDLSAYYLLTNDVQVVSSPTALARGFLLQNSGDAEVYGVEAEVSGRFDIGPGVLNLRATASTSDGEYKGGSTVLIDQNADGVPDVVSLEGNQVPRLRDYAVSFGGTYRFPVTAGLQGSISGSVQLADGGFENPINTETYNGYALGDVRVGLATDRWRLSAFVKNVTDKRYATESIAGVEFYNEPRVYGLELTATF